MRNKWGFTDASEELKRIIEFREGAKLTECISNLSK